MSRVGVWGFRVRTDLLSRYPEPTEALILRDNTLSIPYHLHLETEPLFVKSEPLRRIDAGFPWELQMGLKLQTTNTKLE